jgi:methanogenic corrinoid protein MtbC1
MAGEVPVAATPLGAAPHDREAAHARHAELVDGFIRSATAMDISATGAVLDEIFALGSFESVVDDLLMPALVALGRAWSEGTLDVAAEHAASAAVYRRLSALYEAAAVIGDASVVVGLPPGSRHELGVLAFAVAMRRRGVGVLYLGADVPPSSWVHVIEQNRSRLAVIAVVQEADRVSALAVADALRRVGTGPVVAMGGRAAQWDGAQEAGIVILPERIDEAAVVAARMSRWRSGRGNTQGAET